MAQGREGERHLPRPFARHAASLAKRPEERYRQSRFRADPWSQGPVQRSPSRERGTSATASTSPEQTPGTTPQSRTHAPCLAGPLGCAQKKAGDGYSRPSAQPNQGALDTVMTRTKKGAPQPLDWAPCHGTVTTHTDLGPLHVCRQSHPLHPAPQLRRLQGVNPTGARKHTQPSHRKAQSH